MSGKKRKTDTGAVDRAKKKDKWVKWTACPARQVILDDLQQGALLDSMSAEATFKFYKKCLSSRRSALNNSRLV
jgi:hypothetical protein